MIVCLAKDVDIEAAEHMAREPAEPPLRGHDLYAPVAFIRKRTIIFCVLDATALILIGIVREPFFWN